MATAKTTTVLAAILLVAFLARWSEGGGEVLGSAGAVRGRDPLPVVGTLDGVPGALAGFDVSLRADRHEGVAPLQVEFLFDVEGTGVRWSFDATDDGVPERAGNGTGGGAVLMRYDVPGLHTARLVAERDAMRRETTISVRVIPAGPPSLVRVADPQGDAPSQHADIRWFEARTHRASLEVDIGVESLQRTGPAGPGTVFELAVDGRVFRSHLATPLDARPTTTDPQGAVLPDGTSSWDEERGVVHFRIPASTLEASGVMAPYEVSVKAVDRAGPARLGDDRAPGKGEATLQPSLSGDGPGK